MPGSVFLTLRLNREGRSEPVGRRSCGAQVERERVRALGEFDDDGVVQTLLPIELSELHAQAPGLNADGGIALGIESGGAAEDFGRDLVFLQREARMIQGMLGEVAEQLAQGFRGVQAMTINKFIYLLEALLPTDRERVRHSHITGK